MYRVSGLALVLVSAATALAWAQSAHEVDLLYATEGNRLRLVATGEEIVTHTLVERASLDPESGRDVNGQVCVFPDSDGSFIAGEDTGQPHPPAGWGVFDARGRQGGKLTPTSYARVPEPYGCAFDSEGRLFTTDVGDPGFLEANGQLLLWFPPFNRYPGREGAYPNTDSVSNHFCKIATNIGTAGAIAIDPKGRVYVSSSGRFAIRRFSPPFPTSANAAGGCGAKDELGSPLATQVQDEIFVRGLATYSGLAIAPNGNLYAASVATGRIYEYDLEGNFVRMILEPSEWLPPFSTGFPYGIAVGRSGALYYADLDLTWNLWFDIGPGPNGKLRRIRFNGNGEPQAPEVLLEGLEYPDGVAVFR